MILYRYFKAEDAINTLKKSSLKTSKLSGVNDPFELSWRSKPPTREEAENFVRNSSYGKTYRAIADQKDVPYEQVAAGLEDVSESASSIMRDHEVISQTILRERVAAADARVRFICFSAETITSSADVKMWSLYGDKHSGIRMGFQFPANLADQILPIEYSVTRPEINLFTLDLEEQRSNADRLMNVKSDAWRYEEEWRLYLPLNACENRMVYGKPMEFFWFNPEWVKSIDFGLKCDAIKDIKALIEQQYPQVNLSIAEMHGTDYALQYLEA